jgi:hypothetical protein
MWLWNYKKWICPLYGQDATFHRLNKRQGLNFVSEMNVQKTLVVSRSPPQSCLATYAKCENLSRYKS